jgi:rare lipoprotein A
MTALLAEAGMRRVFEVLGRVMLTACMAGVLFPDGVSARPYLANYFKTHPLTGMASWYGPREAGRRTASGVVFDPAKPSAAHRSLPLGTCVRVTARDSGKSVLVRIIDRGPFVHGRLIDLSEAAAQSLGMTQAGLASVTVEYATACANEL